MTSRTRDALTPASVFVFLTIVLGIATAPLTTVPAHAQRGLIGQPQPGFTLPDLNGRNHTPDDWANQVLVVNFWATWCTPCRKEIPMFNGLQAEYADEGVTFVGIAIDDDKAVKRFMELIPIDYPVLIGGMDAVTLSQNYGNLSGALPFTVFVDRQGNIGAIASGGLNEAVTRRQIDKLL